MDRVEQDPDENDELAVAECEARDFGHGRDRTAGRPAFRRPRGRTFATRRGVRQRRWGPRPGTPADVGRERPRGRCWAGPPGLQSSAMTTRAWRYFDWAL